MGKAAIYNPYLDTLGGGERYTMSFAKVLAEDLGYEVFVQWHDKSISEKISSRFGMKLPASIKFVDSINRGENYDLCFWVSDGSIPTLRAKKNYLHFQVPFRNVNGKSLINKMKLFRINAIICNSNFTAEVIKEEYGTSVVVVYPPIDVVSFKSKRKENMIIYVGRFSSLLQSKGQEILVDKFKDFYKQNNLKWKLVLVGGAEVGADNLIDKLNKMKGKYPVEIIVSPTFTDLKNLVGRAKIFWSATGFGVDETKYPKRVEHFGMTLVEAMSAGCVPVVYSAGGHKEIIESSQNGFLWQNKKDLITLTNRLIKEKGLMVRMSGEAKKRAQKYDYETFRQQILQIIK